ncbi:MAG: hypothetical protein QNJ65_22180 [Xenococcaceae cyanobacterium MO_234.B1]|nr:hypothetical protein [Xenococcaceae cyanobacterium MO_234.B1]
MKDIKGLDKKLKKQLQQQEKLIFQNYFELEEFKQLKSALASWRSLSNYG